MGKEEYSRQREQYVQRLKCDGSPGATLCSSRLQGKHQNSCGGGGTGRVEWVLVESPQERFPLSSSGGGSEQRICTVNERVRHGGKQGGCSHPCLGTGEQHLSSRAQGEGPPTGALAKGVGSTPWPLCPPPSALLGFPLAELN